MDSIGSVSCAAVDVGAASFSTVVSFKAVVVVAAAAATVVVFGLVVA